ncbi:MAG: hypothetical protein ACOX88_10235, partial [Christensenellales bacterium]
DQRGIFIVDILRGAFKDDIDKNSSKNGNEKTHDSILCFKYSGASRQRRPALQSCGVIESERTRACGLF